MRNDFSRQVYVLIGLIGLALIACRVTDLIAQAEAPATRTPTRPRPTFTLAALLVEIPTNTPLPPSPTRRPPPTPRPPTRVPSPTHPVPTLAPPPTPDPDAGFYYKRRNFKCVAAPNTRVEGVVMDSGSLRNGVKVRISFEENGPADTPLPDFVTGTDPADPNHVCPECRGKYRLSPSEGSQMDGNWWVYVVDDGGNPLSKSTFIHTQDGPGCNTATIDFVH